MARFDAFVSYSHREERGVARRLQAGVERFAKPWYRTRALRLFLDTNSLSADPALWSSIERALADSRWFVLVTSPRVVESRWVDKEIRWWLAHRSASRILIVLADGALRWDEVANDFDPVASTALPPALGGAFAEEPHWVEVAGAGSDEEVTGQALGEAVVAVAAPLREISKEDLLAAATRERRRTRRWVAGTIAVLSLLLVAVVAAGLVALDQRGAAEDQAQRALSRQIASASEATAATDLDTAMLLAVQAFRSDPNPQTRAALFKATTSSPSLVRFLDAGGEIESLVGSTDGDEVLAGLVDGRLLLWTDGSGRPTELADFPRRVTSLAISADGSVIAASDRTRVLLWRDGEGPVRLPVPAGLHGDVVGLSPSGETVVYHAEASEYGGETPVLVAAVDDPLEGEAHWGSMSPGPIVVPDDDRALLVQSGSWEWKRFSDWQGEAGSVGMGAHEFALAVSADARYFTKTNGNPYVQVWRTTGKADAGDPDEIVEVPLPEQSALGFSADGSKLAVAGPSQIYVVRVDSPSLQEQLEEALDPSLRPQTLPGQEADLLAFPGPTRLLSAAGDTIAVWDLDQLDRLAEVEPVPLEFGCEACGPPRIAVSEDGRRLALVNGSGSFGFVQSLVGDPGRDEIPSPESEFQYGGPVWSSGGEVAFPIWASPGGANPPLPAGSLPEGARAWVAGEGGDNQLAEVAAAGGEAVIVLDRSGGAYVQDAATGERLDFSPGPPDSPYEEEGVDGAAVEPSAGLLALSNDGVVRVERLDGRELISEIEVGGFPRIAYTDGALLVQLEDGRLQIWDGTGTELRRTLPADGGAGSMGVSPTGTLIARDQPDGTIGLVDLATGSTLARFQTRGESSFFQTGLAFAPAGDALYAVSEVPGGDGELVRRELSDEALVASACAAAGRDLSRAEWGAFVGNDPPADLSCR